MSIIKIAYQASYLENAIKRPTPEMKKPSLILSAPVNVIPNPSDGSVHPSNTRE
jgi:hypothetical protein